MKPPGERNLYCDTVQRMRHDSEFHALVTLLAQAAERHGLTPGELKQIAFAAAIVVEQRHFPRFTLEGDRLVVAAPEPDPEPWYKREGQPWRRVSEWEVWLSADRSQLNFKQDGDSRIHSYSPTRGMSEPGGPHPLINMDPMFELLLGEAQVVHRG